MAGLPQTKIKLIDNGHDRTWAEARQYQPGATYSAGLARYCGRRRHKAERVGSTETP